MSAKRYCLIHRENEVVGDTHMTTDMDRLNEMQKVEKKIDLLAYST